MPAEEKPEEMEVIAAEVVPESSVEAMASDPTEPKPKTEIMTMEEAKESDDVSTPSVVKDIPASKIQQDAFMPASKMQSEPEKVSSTNEIEKAYINELTKPED
jgi:hypothetical protein